MANEITKDFLEQLKSSVDSSARAANAASAAANASTAAMHEIKTEVKNLASEVATIKKSVFGSNPPSGGDPPLDDSVDIALSDAARARIDVGDLREDMKKRFDAIDSKISAQGLGGAHFKGWLPEFGTVEGRKFIVHVLTLVLVAYAAAKQIQLPPGIVPTGVAPAAASSGK